MNRRQLYGKIHFDEVNVEAGQQLTYNYTNNTEHWLMVNRFLIRCGPEAKRWRFLLITDSGKEHILDENNVWDATDEELGSAYMGVSLAPRETIRATVRDAVTAMSVSFMAYEIN